MRQVVGRAAAERERRGRVQQPRYRVRARPDGSIARDAPIAQSTNPIYAEVVPRELTWVHACQWLLEETTWYVDAGGGLDVDKLLGRVPGVLPRALRALAGTVRLRGGGSGSSSCRRVHCNGW